MLFAALELVNDRLGPVGVRLATFEALHRILRQPGRDRPVLLVGHDGEQFLGFFLGSMQKNNEVSILSLQAFHSLKLLGQSETGDCSNFLQAKTCSNLKVRGRMIKIHEDRTEIIH